MSKKGTRREASGPICEYRGRLRECGLSRTEQSTFTLLVELGSPGMAVYCVIFSQIFLEKGEYRNRSLIPLYYT